MKKFVHFYTFCHWVQIKGIKMEMEKKSSISYKKREKRNELTGSWRDKAYPPQLFGTKIENKVEKFLSAPHIESQRGNSSIYTHTHTLSQRIVHNVWIFIRSSSILSKMDKLLTYSYVAFSKVSYNIASTHIQNLIINVYYIYIYVCLCVCVSVLNSPYWRAAHRVQMNKYIYTEFYALEIQAVKLRRF